MRTLRWLTLITADSRYVGQVAIAFALLWPMVLLATDHHGTARLPTHEHVSVGGAAVAPHSHVIVAHSHDGVEHLRDVEVEQASASIGVQTAMSERLQMPAEPYALASVGSPAAPFLAGFASFLAHNSSLPSLASFLIPVVLLRLHPATRGVLAAMTDVAPPTPPPRRLVVV
jgi:hypothetical protein